MFFIIIVSVGCVSAQADNSKRIKKRQLNILGIKPPFVKSNVRRLSRDRNEFPTLIEKINSSDTLILLEVLNYDFEEFSIKNIYPNSTDYDALLFLGGDSVLLFSTTVDTLSGLAKLRVKSISINEDIKTMGLDLSCHNIAMLDINAWIEKNKYRKYEGYFTGNGIVTIIKGNKMYASIVNIDTCFFE